jgi:hypothetical protein
VKKYSEVTEEDKRNYNLIVVGTPNSNPMLKEIYVTKGVIKMYSKEGVLIHILKSLYNSNALLVIAGSSPEYVKKGEKELRNLSDVKYSIVIIGKVETPAFPAAPAFEECIGPAPYIRINSIEFYLKNICSYLNPKEEGLGLFGRIVVVKGDFSKEKGYNVITVSSLKVVRGVKE